jgi:hypothetical protein
MKKYLTLAALAGAVALVSVSYFAQAEEAKTGTTPTAVEKAAPAADATKECETAAAAKKADGTDPTAEEKAAALKKCHEAAAAPAPAEAMKPAEAPAAK